MNDPLPTTVEGLRKWASVRSAARRAKAAERVAEALTAGDRAAMRLSDVMYDAAEDGFDQPDGEGGTYKPDHGYDLDDLAHVLLLLIR